MARNGFRSPSAEFFAFRPGASGPEGGREAFAHHAGRVAESTGLGRQANFASCFVSWFLCHLFFPFVCLIWSFIFSAILQFCFFFCSSFVNHLCYFFGRSACIRTWAFLRDGWDAQRSSHKAASNCRVSQVSPPIWTPLLQFAAGNGLNFFWSKHTLRCQSGIGRRSGKKVGCRANVLSSRPSNKKWAL